MVHRAFLNLRHAAFVGVLAASHFLSVPVRPEDTRRRLPRSSGV
jgi:hypothetical protein